MIKNSLKHNLYKTLTKSGFVDKTGSNLLWCSHAQDTPQRDIDQETGHRRVSKRAHLKGAESNVYRDVRDFPHFARSQFPADQVDFVLREVYLKSICEHILALKPNLVNTEKGASWQSTPCGRRHSGRSEVRDAFTQTTAWCPTAAERHSRQPSGSPRPRHDKPFQRKDDQGRISMFGSAGCCRRSLSSAKWTLATSTKFTSHINEASIFAPINGEAKFLARNRAPRPGRGTE
ncbi:hypothetical protein CONLIGDRAFT_699805 [Coniochaeta ligniaria NRRL 30616]|uniref:Uncharacterized protein n=1 Tax=Coniochaeta ligniaria NRRL 30616 TaxID=1408157 RepID=A0A1J7I433_9PEZI|nr:hypothetical protein CONLIGDRAFT_699805 [Coniochaeta ligniaria NRRL 30616]